MNDIQGPWSRIKEWTQTILVLTVIFGAAWVLPPLVHRARRLCPVVHPDSVSDTFALPAFARKYGVSCSQCHVAFPVLNAYGRQFKMNGYVRDRDGDEGALQSKDKELWVEKIFPWALILRSRPFDLGRQTVSNGSSNFGHTAGFKGLQFQPIADVDLFLAAGDAARHISAFGEYDAQARGPNAGSFAPGGGDFSLGYHPKSWLNFVIGRRSFFGMDPYQTIADNESPTVANRALTGFGLPDQNGLSGNLIGEQTQTAMVYSQLTKDGVGSLYMAAGATSGANDDLGQTAKNANFRVALDNNQGVMVGGFTTFGHETPANIPANGGVANVPNNAFPPPVQDTGRGKNAPWNVRFMKAGLDALVEYRDFAARGAAMYSYDHVTYYDNINDPLTLNALRLKQMKDWAAYAEIAYSYKRNNVDYPFLMPLIRDNWYTTYNGKRSFHFITYHLAHYLRPNVKVFAEYSMDVKTDIQGPPAAIPDVASRRVPRGDRGTVQIEVGF